MIEREFIIQKTKEYYIKKYLENKLKGAGISHIRLKKIPLGEKIIIDASRPSLIVGSKGSNIKELTRILKLEFKLENPQIEINEVKDVFLDAKIAAERIANSLERFGSARFKAIGHKIMENVINSGALGVELIISGKIPGARAKSWRFYQGYLKKCGDIAIEGVRKAKATALLKSGIIGIKVAIMPPDLILPDRMEILAEPITVIEEMKGGVKKEGALSGAAEPKSEKKKGVKKKTAARKETGKGSKGKKKEKNETSDEKEKKEEPKKEVAPEAEKTAVLNGESKEVHSLPPDVGEDEAVIPDEELVEEEVVEDIDTTDIPSETKEKENHSE